VNCLEGTAPDDADELALVAARDHFTDSRIIEVHGGYVAVPAGTVMVQAVTLDGLVAKLSAAKPRRRRRWKLWPPRVPGRRGHDA
jgi:hypothetical protein